MKKLFLIFISMFTFAFCTIDSAFAVDYPFSMTVNIPNSPLYFQFRLSARGTFYVDCGTGGTLSSDDSTANGMISGGTINKTNTMIYVFKCTYSSSGTKTIRFGGTATAYNTQSSTSTLNFYVSSNNAHMITSISGNLSTIFPYISSSNGKYPRFRQTFMFSKITSIPSNLFSNITGAGTYMFYQTFKSCSNLFTFIPSTTFSGLIAKGSPTASNMWSDTFAGSALLTACPSGTSQYTTNYESSWGGKVSCEGTPAITCSSGTYLPKKTTTCATCPAVGTCAGGTFGLSATEDQGLIVTCSSGYYLPSNSITCTTCPTGYTCAGGTFTPGTTIQGRTPNTYTVTLRNYNNTATHGTIYYKYGTGWYSDSTATNQITSVTVPTRSGYAFRGFFTAIQSDLTTTGGTSLIPTIFNTGSIPTSSWVTDNTNLYAGWAKNCAPGTGCACNMNVSSVGSITYTTTPNTGYTITSGMGAYNPVCAKNTINMTFDGVATTPSQCTLDGTFIPPTPSPRTGYIFAGWKVKTITKPYTQLEYLQSDGNQYIDTNTVADLNTKAEIKFMHTQFDSSSVYYGVFGSSFHTNSGFSLSTRYTQDFLVWRRERRIYAISPQPALNTDYVVEMSKDGYDINGVTFNTVVSTEFISDSIYLFHVNGATSVLPLIGKIYYFKLYENGTLVHNFVPARRNSDSVLGMYDTVSDVFLTNSGTGTFTAGPNVGQVGN